MITINTPNINEARKQIDKLSREKQMVAVMSQDDEFNRKALEIKGLNIFVINEELNIKDYSKQRNSGLNEVLARICRDKNIKIGIEIEKIMKKSDIEKAKALARLIQNIALCKRAGCKFIFFGYNNWADKKSIQSLLITLSASTKQASEAAIK